MDTVTTATNHYTEVIKDIRFAISEFYKLPKDTPETVKKAIWKALCHGLDMVQDSLANLD